MISKLYLNQLKSIKIRDFILSNNRAPTESELTNIIKSINDIYYNVDNTGISQIDLEKVTFREASSLDKENKNREIILSDLLVLNKKITNIIDIESDAYRDHLSVLSRISKGLDTLESRVDNLLLIYGTDDIFLNSIEEDFHSLEKVDLTLSTADIKAKNVTIAKNSIELIDLNKCNIKITQTSTLPLSNFLYSNIDFLKENSGRIWYATLSSNSSSNKVALVIDITFDQSYDLSNISMSLFPNNGNSISSLNIFYSTDGITFNSIENSNIAIKENMNIPIGLTSIKRIQLSFSKNVYDDLEENSYIFKFLISKLLLEYNTSTSALESEVISGPYNIVDTNGNNVYFTKASFSACTIEPTGTSVHCYLSQDKVNWYAVDQNQTSNYLTFGDHTPSQAISYIDSSINSSNLVNNIGKTEEFDYNTEAYLNLYVIESFSELIPYRSFTIFRNIINDESPSYLKNAYPGWELNDNVYSTVVYISNPNGRYIDFGNTTAYINNQQVTGYTLIPYGYNKFSTSDKNILFIDENLTTEDSIKSVDSLYPYNHKYLIEGYNYPSSYIGNKTYIGADSIFGSQLVYISQELFDTLEDVDKRYYNVFTIEIVDNALYFKVKVNKSFSDWASEKYSVDFVVQSNPVNTLYFKGILTSNKNILTPVLESFKVRVI